MKARRGPPERRGPMRIGKQNRQRVLQLKKYFNLIEKRRWRFQMEP
jgi:hypothetical protein